MKPSDMKQVIDLDEEEEEEEEDDSPEALTWVQEFEIMKQAILKPVETTVSTC